MSLNWKEIDLILDELTLENCHIQKVYQPDFQSLIFQIYSPAMRFYLLIHLGHGHTRLHAVQTRPEKKVKLQRFAQLLRSRILGGRITEAVQIPRQRIVKLRILRGGETTLLWVRLWGNAANIIATDEKYSIIDAFFRRPRKNEVSGGTYNPESEFNAAPSTNEIIRKDEKYAVREYDTSSTFNEYIDLSYRDSTSLQNLVGKREKAESLLEQQHDRYESQLAGLLTQRNDYKNSVQYKEAGELITTNLYKLNTGDRWLKTENFFRDNETIEIELDPALSPSENAEKYFQKYRKAKSGLVFIEREIRSMEKKLEDILRTSEDLKTSNDIEFIEKVIKSHPAPGKQQKSMDKAPDETPGLRFTSARFTLLVGRNAKESDALLRHHVKGNDYWLHSRDYPGGYVFIKAIKDKSIPLETLLDAGNLAVHYSKAKNTETADLYYTQVKYLRRAKHGKLGTVIPTQEKNLTVTFDEKRLKGLLNQLGDYG